MTMLRQSIFQNQKIAQSLNSNRPNLMKWSNRENGSAIEQLNTMNQTNNIWLKLNYIRMTSCDDKQ